MQAACPRRYRGFQLIRVGQPVPLRQGKLLDFNHGGDTTPLMLLKINIIINKALFLAVILLAGLLQSTAEAQPQVGAEAGSEAEAGIPSETGTPPEAGTPSEAEADGPEIVMPDAPSPVTRAPSGFDPLRGMQEARFQRAAKTAIGGYGELHLNVEWPEGGGSRNAEIDMHRLVLFIAHNFNEDFRFYTELEVEHAFVSSGGAPGEVGIEQAYVDWRLLDSDALSLRTGIILVPLGIINQWHEPPIFHGVERPRVDSVIIPTTWREGGIGILGEPVEGFRYELYLMGGLQAGEFSAARGLRGGRQHVAEANVKGPAISGRLEIEPILGMVAGLGLYVGWAGPNTSLVDAPVIVSGVTGDWRIMKKGFEARAVIAYFHVGDTDALREVPVGETDPISDIGSDVFGTYGEIAYDVLFHAQTEHQLLPFVRVEYYDTTFAEGDAAFNKPSVLEPRIGLSYRPIPQFVIKTDFLVAAVGITTPLNEWNLGVGWMF